MTSMPDKRTFSWTSHAWHAKSGEPEQIHFGNEQGEMTIIWELVGGLPTPRLCVFSESWGLLTTFGNVISELGKISLEADATPEQIVTVLKDCGFEDQTEYESPFSEDETDLRRKLADLERQAAQIRQQLEKR